MFFKSVQMFQDYINNAYLWFWAGVLFKLPQLARRGDRLRIPAEDN
jgi:hypothetical protein